MLAQAAGADPTEVKYIAYDAGGKAMAALLSGEIKALSTGFSEAVAMAKAGEANIIGNIVIALQPRCKNHERAGY